MRLAKVGVLAVAVLAVSSLAFAQTTTVKVDLSGNWVVDTSAMPAPATPPPGGRGPQMPGPMTVTMKDNVLTIERTRGDGTKVTTTYNLAGQESVNKMMGRGGTEVEVKSTTKWDGDKLVITSTRPGQEGATITTTEIWSLADGVLTIESTRPGRDGNPMTTKVVYKKST